MGIFTLEAIEVKLTDYKEGDKLTQYEAILKGDIIVADRAYGTIKTIEYAMKYESDYVLRLRANAFNLYDKVGKRIDFAEKIKKMKQGAYKELNLNCKSRNKLYHVRLCIYRKTDKESENVDIQAKKSNKGRMRGKVSEVQKFYGNFVIVATSLSETPEKILALYRQRWQIKLLFKRLKSIFHLDELPAKKPESVKAWFYGKLLLAAICEALDNIVRFSPCFKFPFEAIQ